MMANLEPMKVEYPVKNTFIEYPAMRSISLEAFMMDREAKSCPSSGLAAAGDDAAALGSMASPAPRAVLTGQEAEKLAEKIGYLVKNTFVEIPAQRSLSLEDFLHDRAAKSCPTSEVLPAAPCDDSTASTASTADERDAALSTPPDSSRPDENSGAGRQAVKLNLAEGLGIWSAGSAGHGAGACKPCAFVWKPEGCAGGAGCEFCHLCPPDELKRRKKAKMVYRKMVTAFKQRVL